MVIDYTQLGLDFKLYSCQVLFNRALCYIELGEMDLGMTDLWRATREKQTKAHDMLDQALRDKGQDCTVFTVPQGVLYRPAESKVKNSKKKDYLGNSKVIAAVDATDQFAGFKGKSAWQVQMSGPTNVATEEPRPMTPPNGKALFLPLTTVDYPPSFVFMVFISFIWVDDGLVPTFLPPLEMVQRKNWISVQFCGFWFYLAPILFCNTALKSTTRGFVSLALIKHMLRLFWFSFRFLHGIAPLYAPLQMLLLGFCVMVATLGTLLF